MKLVTGTTRFISPVHDVNDGLCEGDLLDGRHVESIHILPPVDLVILHNLKLQQQQFINRINEYTNI